MKARENVNASSNNTK